MSDEKPTTFDQWAIVEVMGHSRYAGRVTEQAVGGCSFVRVDSPEIDGLPAFTKLLGQSAIFSITPVTREVAIEAVKRFQARPVVVAGYDQQRLQYGEPEPEDWE